MARRKGTEKGTRKGKGKDKAKNKDEGTSKQVKISSWLGRSTTPELTPEPDELEERNLRKNLRWIHAGVYKDAQDENQDIWYAFKKLKNGQHRIVYASDPYGSSHGNFNVGQIKRNMITFDEHHRRKWRHFLNAKGTWAYRNAKRGRCCQRRTLLETFLDPNFVDPYPNGRDHKVIGPPLNVIHFVNDKSEPVVGRGRGATASASAAPAFTPPDQCYPDTNIPLSTERIKVGAFRKLNKDAMKVISNFLTGNMHFYPSGHVQRRLQLDHIESAFYDQGWRVDRAAMDQALDDMQEPGRNAFDSNAFVQNLPLWVDRYKGREVEELITKVGGKDPNGGSDSDDDSENDQGDDSGDDSGDDDDDPDSMFVGRRPKPKRPGPGGPKKFGPKFMQDLVRMMAGRKNSSSARNSQREDDSDDLEFLPDDSPLKGKAPASKRYAREEVAETPEPTELTEPTEVQHEIQDNDHVEVDEDRNTPAPPAKRIKSEPLMTQTTRDNPIIINDNPLFEDDWEVEFIQERYNVRTKKEPSDNIIVDMTMEDDD